MLSKVGIFSQLNEVSLRKLSKLSVRQHIKSNTLLFEEGDVPDCMYIIDKGTVCISVINDQGNELILNHMTAGEYFGELSLIDGQPRSAIARATTSCDVTTISRESFQDLIQHNPELLLSITKAVILRVRQLTHNARDLALLDVYGRVRKALIKLSDNTGRIGNPKITHQEISNMVGSSREMVTRIMRQLAIGGYIEQSEEYIQLSKKLPIGW